MNKKYIFIALFFLALFSPTFIFAAGTENAVSCVLCKIIHLLTGSIGRSLSIIIVISLGFMLFLGKVTWGLAFAIFIGMSLIFGAENAVSLVGGFGDDASVCASYGDKTKCTSLKKGKSGI